MFGAKKKTSVGLDIGSHSLKVVAVDISPEGEELVAYNLQKRLPQSSQPLEEQIKTIFDDTGISPEAVNLSVSGSDIIVRFVDFPKMDERQLANALSFEAEKYIPFNIDEVILDHIVLGDSEQPGQVRVMIAAARKNAINRLLDICQKLGLQPGVIDSDPFAVFNSFSMFNELPQDDGYAFIDMGYTKSDILLCRGIEPGLMRQIQVGGRDLVKAICKELAVPEEKAMKIKLGLFVDHAERAKEAYLPILENLAREIQLSMGYFENRYSCPIKRIFLSGGESKDKETLDFLKEVLNMELILWDPFEKMVLGDNISKEELPGHASQLVVGLGLALRG